MAEERCFMVLLCWLQVSASISNSILSLVVAFSEAGEPSSAIALPTWQNVQFHGCGRAGRSWRQLVCRWRRRRDHGPDWSHVWRSAAFPARWHRSCRPPFCVSVCPLVTACSWVRHGRRREPSHVWKPQRSAARPGVRLQPGGRNPALVTHD